MQTTAIILGCVLTFGCSSMNTVDIINYLVPKSSYSKQVVTFSETHRLSMDVYTLNKTQEPSNKAPIVFIYGGAWRTGNKEEYEFLAQALISLGHSVIIPDYRKYPEVTFPLFIDDVANAIAFLEKNSQQLLGKKLTQYILMGHSSGAHAASLLSADQTYFQQRNVTAEIAGLIAVSGPHGLDLNDPEVVDVFENATPENANPEQILRNNLSIKMPNTLLLHGLKDTRVSPQYTKNFNTVLNELDQPVTMHLYEKVNHTKIIGYLAAPLRFLGKSYNDIAEFLQTLNN